VDPAARATARMIEEACDTHYEAINWGMSEIRWFGRASGELADKLRAAAARQTAAIQAWLGEKLGGAAWFGGETFGWADLAAAPYVHRSSLTDLGPAAGTPLAAWLARLRARPSVAETFAESKAAEGRMTDVTKRLADGSFKREYRD